MICFGYLYDSGSVYAYEKWLQVLIPCDEFFSILYIAHLCTVFIHDSFHILFVVLVQGLVNSLQRATA